MMNAQSEPLISVVITCYNQGKYLGKAIQSVLAQEEYVNYEIVVVDDGSTDDTKLVATSFAGVKYVYKKNAGLAEARNTGIDNSSGVYLLFLDADDWLFPNALSTNSKYLISRDDIAFVSGNHQFYFEWNSTFAPYDAAIEVQELHYAKLLETNYISMHGTVLYQRWAFDDLRYDPSLITHEDFDIHLRIARKFPVMHHQVLIAVYRIHTENMSRDSVSMYEGVLSVFKKQEAGLKDDMEKEAYRKGIRRYKNHFEKKIFDSLISGRSQQQWRKKEEEFLFRSNRSLYLKLKWLRLKHFFTRSLNQIKN